MTLDACASLIANHDPDRFMALMASPVALRPRLMPLYAMNVELARISWSVKEPMIAEMRLQWWRDALFEGAPPKHEVAGLVHALIRAHNLPLAPFDALIDARRAELEPDGFADDAAFFDYLEQTGGGLMWLAACATDAPEITEQSVRGYGFAAAMANYLAATARLMAAGRRALPQANPHAITALAEAALERFDYAITLPQRAIRQAVLPAWQARPLLRLAMRSPQRVLDGSLHLPEFVRRGRLLWLGLTRGVVR